MLAELKDQNLHYNTVSTIIRNLEEKAYVSHKAYGKTHQYFPVVSKEKYRKQFMNIATKRFFDNSFKSVVSYFAKEEKISADELCQILDIIEKEMESFLIYLLQAYALPGIFYLSYFNSSGTGTIMIGLSKDGGIIISNKVSKDQF